MDRFRYKRGIPLEYDVQGYIYFLSRRYRRLPQAKRKKIDELCSKAGEQYEPALKAYVTTARSAEEICEKFFLSESTLERLVKRYYVLFAQEL